MSICTNRDYVRLVLAFPVLGGRPGLGRAPGVTDEGIDLRTLDAWAAGDPDTYTAERGPFPGDAAKDAVRFVLAVFSTMHPWRVGPFDLFRALQTWDHEQREAFASWLTYPVRP